MSRRSSCRRPPRRPTPWPGWSSTRPVRCPRRRTRSPRGARQRTRRSGRPGSGCCRAEVGRRVRAGPAARSAAAGHRRGHAGGRGGCRSGRACATSRQGDPELCSSGLSSSLRGGPARSRLDARREGEEPRRRWPGGTAVGSHPCLPSVEGGSLEGAFPPPLAPTPKQGAQQRHVRLTAVAPAVARRPRGARRTAAWRAGRRGAPGWIWCPAGAAVLARPPSTGRRCGGRRRRPRGGGSRSPRPAPGRPW